MKQKLIDVTDVVAGGILPALDQSSNPLWADGSNVVFQENSIRPIPSQIGVAGKLSTEPPRGAIEVRFAGARTVFWGTQTKLFKLVEGSGTPTDVTRAAGAYTGVKDSTTTQDATVWSFAQWGDNALVATNGVDVPQYFEHGDTKFTNFNDATKLNASGHPTTAEVMVRLENLMLAANTNSSEVEIVWCDEDNLAVWTPAADNAAGSIVLRGFNSPIITALPLQSGIAVYGSDVLFLLTWIGPPFYIGQQPLLSGVGAIGKNAVTQVGRMHYGVSQRGIFKTDGVEVEWIGKPGIHDYLFTRSSTASGRVNSAQAAKIVAWHDPTQTMVYFFYPAENEIEPGRGVGYNYVNNSWTLLSYGRTAATSGTVFFNPFLFDANGSIFQQVVGDFAPSIGTSPLTLEAEATYVIGYGYAGYGQGGYGGTTYVDG